MTTQWWSGYLKKREEREWLPNSPFAVYTNRSNMVLDNFALACLKDAARVGRPAAAYAPYLHCLTPKTTSHAHGRGVREREAP
ncbi:hypothetical protein EVAR_79403_1 [Eumeta japonica]|uniref:Uncharacterized protein n=1 Tax=Eumeta variegata TaxID=151549 RepID=A0A4C1VFT6_EUMVA|nr:hypothetical protein EVAR_79403_1 [Eumeta japonica]